MQAIPHAHKQWLMETKITSLILNKRELVDVPHTATLAETMNTLVTNHVLAVPVSAPPGHRIGAGGSMVMETDKESGGLRKQYTGIVTMLDILTHIAGGDDEMGGGGVDLEKKMAAPVTSLIGHNLEGQMLWTFSPNTSVLDCMEVFGKGVHRGLVPLDTDSSNVSGVVELAEAAPSYRMVTQMDVLRFLKGHSAQMQLGDIFSRSIKDSGALHRMVYAITDKTKVIDAIRCMRSALINAVPIVASEENEEDDGLFLEGQGRKLVGTFSATDLRGWHLSTLQSWLPSTAIDFTEKVWTSPLYAPGQQSRSRELVTCTAESTLAEVMDKAVTKHVHRLWVVDGEGLLAGVVSLTDVIRAVRVAILSA